MSKSQNHSVEMTSKILTDRLNRQQQQTTTENNTQQRQQHRTTDKNRQQKTTSGNRQIDVKLIFRTIMSSLR